MPHYFSLANPALRVIALYDARMTSRRGGTASLGTLALLVAVVAAVAAALTVVFVWRPVPTSLATPATASGTVAVEPNEFDDVRQVELRATSGAAGKLIATRSGTVTSSACVPGAAIASGSVLATVDGKPVVALATQMPLYRDLVVGSKGADVTALRAELHRLGKTTSPGGGAADRALLRAATALVGPAAAVLPKGSFAWIPAQTAVPATCEAPTGSTIAAGASFGDLVPAVTRVDLATVPADGLPGDRVITIGPVTAPVPKAGITDAATLAKIVATPAFATYTQSDGKAPLQGQWRLATPLRVANLPASAIQAAGGATCVAVGGKATPIRVLGSTLGRSIVTFTGTWPTAVDVTPPPGLTCG